MDKELRDDQNINRHKNHVETAIKILGKQSGRIKFAIGIANNSRTGLFNDTGDLR